MQSLLQADQLSDLMRPLIGRAFVRLHPVGQFSIGFLACFVRITIPIDRRLARVLFWPLLIGLIFIAGHDRPIQQLLQVLLGPVV